MKALIKTPNKEPEIINLKQPSLKNNSHVLVKMMAVGLCRTDLAVANNELVLNKKVILGHECSGIVVFDPLGVYQNHLVAINPFSNDEFMGLDIDGGLVEYLEVPRNRLIDTKLWCPKLTAYVEPVAASLAILNADLNCNDQGFIFGNNRIAELTFIISEIAGLKIKWIKNEKELNQLKDSSFDYIIETNFNENIIEKMMHLLKNKGKLIVKSRKQQKTLINSNLMVKKNLILQAVNYYDFDLSMKWLELNHEKINHLIGSSYHFSDWKTAFKEASLNEEKKIFIHF